MTAQPDQEPAYARRADRTDSGARGRPILTVGERDVGLQWVSQQMATKGNDVTTLGGWGGNTTEDERGASPRGRGDDRCVKTRYGGGVATTAVGLRVPMDDTQEVQERTKAGPAAARATMLRWRCMQGTRRVRGRCRARGESAKTTRQADRQDGAIRLLADFAASCISCNPRQGAPLSVKDGDRLATASKTSEFHRDIRVKSPDKMGGIADSSQEWAQKSTTDPYRKEQCSPRWGLGTQAISWRKL
ncbi:hypothetical protein C8J57DRAFT_1575497 [Mycena rebaudengoi]|nr:hypothetical protein C8J57DRAFT_1575497 [Mycena rebaudengoi]